MKCSGAPQACLGGSESFQNHDPMALSVFGGWISGGVGGAILDTFIDLEASQGVPGPIENPATHLIVGGPGAAESYLRSEVPKT